MAVPIKSDKMVKVQVFCESLKNLINLPYGFDIYLKVSYFKNVFLVSSISSEKQTKTSRPEVS